MKKNRNILLLCKTNAREERRKGNLIFHDDKQNFSYIDESYRVTENFSPEMDINLYLQWLLHRLMFTIIPYSSDSVSFWFYAQSENQPAFVVIETSSLGAHAPSSHASLVDTLDVFEH